MNCINIRLLAYVLTVVISFPYTSINQLLKVKLRKYEMRTRKQFQFSQTIYCQNLQQLWIHLRYVWNWIQTQGFICDLFCLVSRIYCSLCLCLFKICRGILSRKRDGKNNHFIQPGSAFRKSKGKCHSHFECTTYMVCNPKLTNPFVSCFHLSENIFWSKTSKHLSSYWWKDEICLKWNTSLWTWQ